MFIDTAIDGGCTILFVLNQVISGPKRMSSRPQEDLDPGLCVKKAEVPLPRLRGARPSTGLGSATSPHCWWPPATSPPPLGESCTHRPCHPHPSCPLLKGPDDQDYCIPLKYILSQTWRFSSTIPNRYKPHSTSLHQVYHTTAGFKMSHRSNAKYLKKGQFV